MTVGSQSRSLKTPSLAFALALLAWLGMAHAAKAATGCQGDDGGSSLVTEIRGGDTLILEDGRAVRPMGVLIPKRASEAGVTAQARYDAEKALSELVLGKVVFFSLDTRTRDRYGRLLAQISVAHGAERIWVQERLIAQGLARVISFKDNRRCVLELLALEAAAREGRQGHWASGIFTVKTAAAEQTLSDLAQSYEIVEGKIENVAEVKGRIYLNFGSNWRKDFTVTIASEAAKLFPGEGQALSALAGKSVRVRGWIENFNGPSISLTHPEQLEVLEASLAKR